MLKCHKAAEASGVGPPDSVVDKATGPVAAAAPSERKSALLRVWLSWPAAIGVPQACLVQGCVGDSA